MNAEMLKNILSKIDFLNTSYMKKIYFLGILKEKNNNDYIYDFFFKTHGEIYKLNFEIKRTDLGFDFCVDDINIKSTKINTIDDLNKIIKNIKKNNNKNILIYNNKNNIELNINEDSISTEAFSIYTDFKSIYSNIISIYNSHYKNVDINEFENEIISNFPIEKIIEYNKTNEGSSIKNKNTNEKGER